ncbi:MAG: hypothetical protein FJ037_00800 [Chloroflexi bacterium]|nr:hypothetical protein [Chloroflexota bacterium]
MHRPHRGFPHAALLTIVALTLISSLIAGACSGGGEEKWDARSLEQTVAEVPFAPIIVNSNLGVGKNRLSLALFDDNQEFITNAQVTATFYHLDKEPEGEPKNPKRVGEAPLLPHTLKGIGVSRLGGVLVSRIPRAPSTDLGDLHIGHDSTVYTSLVDFDRAGFWGVSLDVKTKEKTYSGLRLVFVVQERTREPRIGDPAPASKQLTLADVKSVDEVDTSLTPNPELHRLTVAQAITSGKPTVVAFVTPAFCQTRFCGPVLDQVVTPAWNEFKDQINVLHIEPYDIAKARGGKLETVPAVEEWKLLAEPMIFVVGRDGIITAKFEGIMDYPELQTAIRETLK